MKSLNSGRRHFLGVTVNTGKIFALAGATNSSFAALNKGKLTTALPPLPAAQFHLDQQVRIASDRFPIGHYRTPMYIRGKTGTIERILPHFLNPEEEGYGKNEGSKVRLYRVRFKQKDLWENYSGKATDELHIEIYEHWLEKI